MSELPSPYSRGTIDSLVEKTLSRPVTVGNYGIPMLTGCFRNKETPSNFSLKGEDTFFRLLIIEK